MDELGATPTATGTRFRVWAPGWNQVRVACQGREVALQRDAEGYWTGAIAGVGPGDRYFYVNGHRRLPDPVSRRLPEGVHGPTEIVSSTAFPWTDAAWRGQAWSEQVLYELHVGTFTPEGTFDAVIPRLAALRDLGVTCLELMPVNGWSGPHNWGYDGVALFAVQESYGGPEGLKRLVDAAHAAGLSVLLDVVYNHLGPEGCNLPLFGPYLSDARTPWGQGLRFHGPDSGPVRTFFLNNAEYWIREYRLDGFRFDATHALRDPGPEPIAAALNRLLDDLSVELGRPVHRVAEDNRNLRLPVEPRAQGGHGFHAQWNDDFHNAVHAFLTGERSGELADFGEFRHIVAAVRQGFVLEGQASVFRGGPWGVPAHDLPGECFVHYIQNHDQVGNRAGGERSNTLIPPAAFRSAVALLLLAPYVPMLFQGQEYGETAPFPFFTSFQDPGLADAVRKGRQEEMTRHGRSGVSLDPQDPDTFFAGKIRWEARDQALHEPYWRWHRALLALRRTWPGALRCDRLDLQVEADAGGHPVLRLRRLSVGLEAWISLSPDVERPQWPTPDAPVLLDSYAPEFRVPSETGELGRKDLLPFQTRVFGVRPVESEKWKGAARASSSFPLATFNSKLKRLDAEVQRQLRRADRP